MSEGGQPPVKSVSTVQGRVLSEDVRRHVLSSALWRLRRAPSVRGGGEDPESGRHNLVQAQMGVCLFSQSKGTIGLAFGSISARGGGQGRAGRPWCLVLV
jgi:hypothetical protein